MVILRNTLSKQTLEVSEEEAETILAHPKFGLVNEIVESHKVEQLARPYTLDDDGHRHYVKPDEDVTNEDVTNDDDKKDQE